MAYIRVDQAMPVFDGQPVTFKSPADCSAIDALKIYYPAENGTETSAVFAFADAHGNNVGDIDHLFGENVLVKVILHTENSMAFVQNADTNAYLEGRFKELQYVNAGVNYDDNASAALTPTGARMSANILYNLMNNTQSDAVRINSVSVKLTAAGTVRFGAYSLTRSAEGTSGTLTLEKLLGEVTLDSAGTAELAIDDGWYVDGQAFLIACAESAIIEYHNVAGGLTLTGVPYFEDANYYGNREGNTISCDLGKHTLQTAIGSVNYDAIQHMTVEEYALETSTAAKELEARVKKAENDIAELMYEPIDITAFSVTPSVAEKGSTVENASFTWEINRDPKTLTFDGTNIDSTLRKTTLTGLSVTKKKTWKLQALDERYASDSMDATLSFYNGIYYGMAAAPATVDSEFIKALGGKVISGNAARTVNVTGGEGLYLWYAYPASLGAVKFNIGGFDYEYDAETVPFTNDYGVTENYYVYKSGQPILSSVSVTVKGA